MLFRTLDETEMIALCSSALLFPLSYPQRGNSVCGWMVRGRMPRFFILSFFSLPVSQTHVGRCRRDGWGRGWCTPLPDSDNC